MSTTFGSCRRVASRVPGMGAAAGRCCRPAAAPPVAAPGSHGIRPATLLCSQTMRRYHIQDRDDYKKYNKLCGMVTKVRMRLELPDFDGSSEEQGRAGNWPLDAPLLTHPRSRCSADGGDAQAAGPKGRHADRAHRTGKQRGGGPLLSTLVQVCRCDCCDAAGISNRMEVMGLARNRDHRHSCAHCRHCGRR